MPSLRTVKNVEILHAGIEYALSTGPTTFTPEDLMDVVMAANEDPSIPNPRLKIGHIDPRFNGSEFDGSPSFGKATNLRLSENGMAVMADYVGVPGWLAEIMPTAYPSRSIEGYWNVESQMGKKWRFVLSACSLLGVTWPGVTVLEDLPQYYEDEMPPGIVIDAEVVAASRQPGGDPVKLPFGKKDGTAASANLDDVRRAFYNEYLPENHEYLWWWIQAILVDPNELVVEDDETGQLYKVSFASDAEGVVTFGDPEEVRIDYIPDNRDATKAAAPHVAATLAVGRTVLASYQSRAESRPANASGGAMDPKEVRERLGLPEDASDEQVKEALKELNTAAGVTPAAEEPAPGPAAGTTVTPAATGVPEPGASVTQTGATAEDDPNNVATASGKVPAGMVLIDQATLETLKVGASAGIEVKTRTEKNEREQLVSAAIADGRIAPAGRPHWLNSLENDPTAKDTLASLTPGLVPVAMREIGHGGGGPEGTLATGDLAPEVVEGWTDNLFPEVRNWRAGERARAAGGDLGRPRITADASYRR